jgi:hypothetical protein
MGREWESSERSARGESAETGRGTVRILGFSRPSIRPGEKNSIGGRIAVVGKHLRSMSVSLRKNVRSLVRLRSSLTALHGTHH